MFARYQTQLHCLSSSWGLLLVRGITFTRDQTSVLLVIMVRPLVAHQDYWAYCFLVQRLDVSQAELDAHVGMLEAYGHACLQACMYGSYVVLEACMDACELYTGVGSTLWAWYACMVEAGTPVYMLSLIHI